MTATPFSKRSNLASTFTEWLREQNQENWDAAINHHFIDELFDGRVKITSDYFAASVKYTLFTFLDREEIEER